MNAFASDYPNHHIWKPTNNQGVIQQYCIYGSTATKAHLGCIILKLILVCMYMHIWLAPSLPIIYNTNHTSTTSLWYDFYLV